MQPHIVLRKIALHPEEYSPMKMRLTLTLTWDGPLNPDDDYDDIHNTLLETISEALINQVEIHHHTISDVELQPFTILLDTDDTDDSDIFREAYNPFSDN